MPISSPHNGLVWSSGHFTHGNVKVFLLECGSGYGDITQIGIYG